MKRDEIERRLFLAGLAGTAAAAVAGCTSRSSGSAQASSPEAASTPAVTPSSQPPSASATPSAAVAGLPHVTPWQPTSAEVDGAVKVRAVRLLEALGTWSAAAQTTWGGPGLASARSRVARLGYDPRLADQAAVMLGSQPAATVQVVDAQYGGILSSSSSVLVVLRQWRLAADGTKVLSGGTTVDVRLVKASPAWRVTALHPAQPSPPAASLSTSAASLLASPRVRLPVAAHADVASGTISPGVLAALHGLAAKHVVDVSVVKSGHPLYVFGTSRLSDHPRGHAVDVWAIDGHPVVNPANRALVESVMRLGIALGAYQVGGPVDLDGGGSRYFSDNTHHDHVHLGFHT